MPDRPGPDGGGSRRGGGARVAGVLGLAAAIAASGLGLDRGLGPRTSPAPAASGGASGSWYCPHGGGEGWSGWAVLANPGTEDVTVRTSTTGPRGVVESATFVVGAGREVYREVPAGQPGAATQVEYFGGWIGAATVIRPASPEPGLAAMRCTGGSRRTWYLPDAPTTTDRTAYMVVMNPFSTPANFDVFLQTEKRSSIHPGVLSPYVLEPHRSVAVRLNDFALQSPGEETMTARVETRIGRVIVGSVDLSPGGVRAEAAVPQAEEEWVFPAAGYSGGAALVLMNPGEARSDLSIVAQGAQRQELASGVDGLSLAPATVATFAVAGPPNAGTFVGSANARPVVASLRVTGSVGDPAQVAGTSVSSRRWLVLPSLPPDGGRTMLVFQNAGDRASSLTITLLGPEGTVATPGRLSSVSVGPGRTVAVPLRAGAGIPVSAVITAEGGAIVAATASTARSGFAVTLGLPMPG